MTEAPSRIHWRAIAEKLGTITYTEGGFNQQGGTSVACDALVEILGDTALIDAVDFYVTGQPGCETALSVLRLLQPPAAMNRCHEIFLTATDPQVASDAIFLLKSIADKRAFDWVPQYLASDNPGVRVGALGVIDQLLIMQESIELQQAMPLIDTALRDPDERVRSQAAQLIELIEHEARCAAAPTEPDDVR